MQGAAFSVLVTTVNTNLKAVALTPGQYYQFKVEARNSYGYSDYSETLTLLAAYIPSVPQDVESANINDKVSF